MIINNNTSDRRFKLINYNSVRPKIISKIRDNGVTPVELRTMYCVRSAVAHATDPPSPRSRRTQGKDKGRCSLAPTASQELRPLRRRNSNRSYRHDLIFSAFAADS